MYFSIIVATYNSELTISHTLKSIVDQEFNDYQLIVIDGASKDDTVNVVKKYSKHIDYFISEPDLGVYDAWNKAIKKAKGDWVLFLGSDDKFVDKNSLSVMYKEVEKLILPCRFIFSKVALVQDLSTMDSAIEILGEKDEGYYHKHFFNEMGFSHTGCLHRRSLFEQYGSFCTDLKIVADYEFMLRCAKNHINEIIKIDELLVLMSAGGLSSSASSRVTVYKETLKARKMHLIPGVPILLYLRLVKAYLIYFIWRIFGESMLLTIVNIYRRVLGKPLRKSYK